MTASLAILDLERLLTPIAGENPSGESLRWDPVWDEISQLRKSRTDPLDASANKFSDWAKVVDVATDALETRTKDLLIAGWLTEALVRESGFAGFRDGLRLINGFVDRFWDSVHPQIEDGDMSNRAAPFTWLTSKDGGARMPTALREIPVAKSAGEPTLNWNFWYMRRIAPQGKDESEDSFKRRSDEAEQNRSTFDAAVDASPILFYQTLLADIDACLAEIELMKVSLDQRLGDLSPTWGDLRNSIEEIRVFVFGVLKRRGGLVEATVAAKDGSTNVTTASEGHQHNANSGVIGSRADAIARLEAAARYFSETEPHSPVAYLVRRAVRWAGMPLEAVLGELVKDDKVVQQIGEMLGISSSPREE